MADQPDPGKIEVFEAAIAELKAQNQALREAATRRDQEIAALHEQVAARDHKIAALEAEIVELKAENAERRTENVRLHERVALQEHLLAALNGYADRGWTALDAIAGELRNVDRVAPDLVYEDTASTVLPMHVVAYLENQARDVAKAAADIKSSDLIKACRWLLQALDENHPVGNVIAAAMTVAWYGGKGDRELLRQQVRALSRDVPKWSSVGEWFEQMCKQARKSERKRTVPPMVVVRLVDEGLRGNTLMNRIREDTGAEERTAWRAIAWHNAGAVFLFKQDTDGQVWLRSLPPY